MTTTDRATVVGAARSPKGYWRLTGGPGEEHLVRSELVSGTSDSLGEPLLTIGHLSDLHLCDSQSPARAEFLDRWGDDDAPTKSAVGYIGTHRAQDCLTVQVGDAMVRALNAVPAGPVGGAALDWAITTGDVTDNAQENEVGWYLGLLDGGQIVPDSGDPDRYEGVFDHDHWDESFWHPDPAADLDRPRRLHGFPDAPGLLDALRQPFVATGLAMPWLAVHGNHDQMIQGTIPAVGPFAEAGNETRKAIGVPLDWTTDAIAAFVTAVDNCNLEALALWEQMQFRTITPDPRRRALSRSEFIAAHFGAAARPAGHGFARSAVEPGLAYYRYDHGQVTVLVLDTVNEHGGWQGSLDAEQFGWLSAELDAADRERRYVVLASHHPPAALINSTGPDRVLGDELALMLQGHPSLVAWLNGHTHVSAVTGHGSWWEVTAPSLIDFPQQGRIVELMRSDAGVLTIASTMLDHTGELPWSGRLGSVTAIAGLSRELAANDWQWQTDDLNKHWRVGTPADRNVLLQLPDPFEPSPRR
jgi:metallophosphoesterase (TIGR03767 family)